MILSFFVCEPHSKNRIFRSSQPFSSSQINYYITEFLSLDTSSEGVVEKETYNYVYITRDILKFVVQVTKDHFTKAAFTLLRYIEKNSSDDLVDILITVDNTIFDGEVLRLDLEPIKEMDSQEEKIYNMMLENKRLEMIQREKEEKKRMISEQIMEKKVPVAEVKPKKVEKSSMPVLIVIKEKIRIEMDKENYIKENVLNGEINLIITDPKYRHLSIKMTNLSASLKYSPYLDKDALKKHILRFEKDRGLNKNIPLLKWAGKGSKLPVKMEFWNDEDGEKNVNIVEIAAAVNVRNLQLKFKREGITDVEINQDGEIEEDEIIWAVGSLRQGESKTIEIKGCSFDKDAIFPITVNFSCESVETKINVEKIFVEEENVSEFEVRKMTEVDDFKVTNE